MKQHLSLTLAMAAAIVMIIATAMVQGHWTERWRPSISEELKAFVAAIPTIPQTLGDWDGEDHARKNERELAVAGAAGHLSRSYRNPAKNLALSVFLICGASRDVAVHTPDACYPGAGFRQEGKPAKLQVKYTTAAGQPATADMMTVVFLKDEPTGTQRLRVFWVWNAYGTWESPEWPRIRFGGRTALNKLYLICPEPTEQAAEQSPALEFAQLFLPAVDQRLFPVGK